MKINHKSIIITIKVATKNVDKMLLSHNINYLHYQISYLNMFGFSTVIA